MTGYDTWITQNTPSAAVMRFFMSVPGQMLVNTAAFRLPEELRIEPTWRVLDVGCGRASLSRVLAQRAGLQQQPVAVDVSREMLMLGRRDQLRDGVSAARLVQGSAIRLPLGDNIFNFTVSAHTVKYLTDDELAEMFTEVRRVMKPGALFLAWEFAPTRSPALDRWNRYVLEQGVPFARFRTYRELRQMAYDSGFDWVQNAGLRPFLLPPIPRVSLIMGKAPEGWRSTVAHGRRVMEPVATEE